MGRAHPPLTASRRSVLRGAGLSALGLTGVSALAGCGTSGAKVDQAECEATDVSAKQKVINFSNWPQYVDPNNKKGTSTLQTFTQDSGIQVNYDTGVNSNEEYFAKVSPLLKACSNLDTDVFVVTDYMAAKMIDFGWIQPLDMAKMPNVEQNLLTSLKSPAWDPERVHSVPWQSGMTGICYNTELVGKPVRSFEELLTRPDLKGRVTLLSEMRDTMLFALLAAGHNPDDFTSAQYDKALTIVQRAVDAQQIRQFTGNDYIKSLQSGDVVACEAWSGDIWQLGGKFTWVPAEEGISFWTDNMLVPNPATHKANVEQMMNFYYDPVNAAKLAAWNYYVSPVQGAKDEMGQFDKSAVQNPLIFPPPSWQERFYGFMPLTQQEETDYLAKFNQVMGG